MKAAGAKVGVVVIGRNEGARLISCLLSLGELAASTVYVDSGSTDGSAEAARRLGAAVVELDMTLPFTAARARNAGFARLEAVRPELEFVQFVDGDCTLAPEWITRAHAFLAAHDDVAVVAGRRRERAPGQSVYNALCDREWDTPVGEATETGGDCLVRAAAFRKVGGYAPDLIAGEEPEMCVRLRGAAWRIWRLDAEMTLHDANIMRFGQWWRRATRAGHAYAEVAARHAGSPHAIWSANVRRALLWGFALPAAILAAAVVFHPALLALLLLYPLQVARIALRERVAGRSGWTYALFVTLAKFPEAQGVVRFYANRLLRRRAAIIEYK
ncbi:glycosyltransferase family 2 protein [Aminobacter sp. BE322]|uniref:glycosyltransferase family 2 protein n=1 Tax=unclassified Aminobacter TaxID=2644704 RepID=UPI003D1D243B